MADKAKTLPYMLAHTNVGTVLQKIKKAKTPPRFTQDFLSTNLGVKSSSARSFIPFAKRVGLLNQDATPTELYQKFRSTAAARSKGAIADAMRKGYEPLFAVDEYAHKLSRDELEGIIIQVTGLEADSRVLKSIASSFEQLRELADFDAAREVGEEEDVESEPPADETSRQPTTEGLRLGLSYTINLVLPNTSDAAVFNAIFRSLRENLLRQ